MKILFDANTPAPLARFLRGMRWFGRTNSAGRAGETDALLDAAEQAGFDLLRACDQNGRYQQNLTNRRLAPVVLSSNHWPTLRV